MSSAGHPNDHRRQDTWTATDLAERLRQLSLDLATLDARAEARSAELGAKLSMTMRALELIHDDDPGARRRLRELRREPGYRLAFTAPDPLVSIVIPTWNRVDSLINRAVPSALGQTHSNLEVIVVGDASPPEVEQALAELADPRVLFCNLTLRGPYEEDRYRAWLASGTPGLNAGVAMASGSWIAPLGDDDEFGSSHLERLLCEARARRLEFVYGRGRVILPDGRETVLGEFPPRLTQVGLQSAIYHAGLRFMELELGHALFGKPNDWGLVHRMMRVGVRMGMVDDLTVTYRPSLRAQVTAEGGHELAQPPPTNPSSLEANAADGGFAARVSELEHLLDYERALNGTLHRRLEEVRRSRSWRLTAPLRRLRARTRGKPDGTSPEMTPR